MTQPRRYHNRQQKAKERQRAKLRERLAQEQSRAQRYLQGVERAVQALGLPATVAEEVEWRLQAQGKRLAKLCGLMFPPFLPAAATGNCAGSAAGTRTCPAGSWAPCPSASGSGGGTGWAKSCWCGCGGTSKTKARRLGVGGSGRGWLTTVSSKSLVSSWGGWVPGTAAKSIVCGLASMACGWWW